MFEFWKEEIHKDKMQIEKDEKFMKKYQKESFESFVTGTNRNLRNQEGATIFFKMIESYILIEEYDLSEKDIIGRSTKYLNETSKKSISNLLFKKW